MIINYSLVDNFGFDKGTLAIQTDDALTSPVQRHYLRQIKELQFGIDNIHFLGEHPAVYFKSVPNFEEETLIELAHIQKNIWNQGKVPFLYVESPTEIRGYNGFGKPINAKNQAQSITDLQLFGAAKDDEQALNELKTVFGAVAIESGSFWEKTAYSHKIKFSTRIEQTLISNLTEARRKLKASLDVEIIHAILLRSLFLLYLEDRKATDAAFYQKYKQDAQSFFDILEDKEATYAIFEKLEVAFNGNLCPVSPNEKAKVTPQHLAMVRECFWSKPPKNKKQTVLWDWRMFDFSIIPIELISGIYENFLSEEEGGAEKQAKTGAFYTPLPLAEFMLNKVLPYPSEQDNNFNIKVLDPTCGSGIFLVESLNRLLDRWEMAHIHQKLTFDIICQITKDNIFGIEQEKEAIKVTAFSLYLAMLNRLDPKTLWQNGRFPYLIYDPENAESEKQGHNLFRMSTISSGPFEDIEYDLVVGNPPFKRGNLEAEVKAYLTKEEFAQEAVLAFLHKAVEKLCPNGKIALVFGVKVLFNTGSLYQNFRNFLFEKTYVTEIYNFAILRKATQEEGGSLFGNASGPAGILFYNKTAPPKPAETLLYCAPKTVVKNRFMNGMAIDMTDVKYLPRTECKKPNTPIWKIAMWGTERDFSLVQNLTSEKTLLTVFEDNHWKKNAGVGFQTSKPFLYTNHEIPKLPYIDADKMERYFTSVDKTAKITDNQFSREGNLSAYKSPHLLLKAGQEKDTKKFCSSFLDYDCSFKKTIYGIHIPEGEKELKLLSAYLNSELIAYIMFLTTANWGIEREEVNPREVLRLPDLCFSLPEDKKEAIIQCVEEVIAIKKQNLAIYSIVEIEKKIDQLFYEALNLSANEQILIEDLIHLTLDGFQHKKESIAFRPTHAAEMQVYGALLSKNINNFLKFGGSLTSWVSIFPVPPSIPLNIIALRFNKAQEAGFVAETAKANVAAIMQEIAEFTYQKYAESIYYRKFVKYYSGDTIYLIKPNEKRFWSRSAALNDADEMIAEMNKRKS